MFQPQLLRGPLVDRCVGCGGRVVAGSSVGTAVVLVEAEAGILCSCQCVCGTDDCVNLCGALSNDTGYILSV